MTRKQYTVESISEEGLKLIGIFNSLTAEEQSLVVDILHDALYDRNLRLVMAGRICLEKDREAQALQEKIDGLEKRLSELEYQAEDRRMEDRELEKAYAEIPRDERRSLKKEVVKEFYYKSLVKSLNIFRTENGRLRKLLSETTVPITETPCLKSE